MSLFGAIGQMQAVAAASAAAQAQAQRAYQHQHDMAYFPNQIDLVRNADGSYCLPELLSAKAR